MKVLGHVLFVTGVIVSSCFAARAVTPTASGPDGVITAKDRVQAWGEAAGAPFAVGVVLMVAGGVLARRRRRGGMAQGTEHPGGAPEGAVDLALEGEAPHARVATGSHRPPRRIVQAIRGKLAVLGADSAPEAVFAAVDDILENDIPELLEQRQALIDDLGLAKFAEMIGHFAMMERNVARAWSAITDGAVGEIPECLSRAKLGIEMAGRSLS